MARTTKTPAEMVAELENKLATAKAKEARETAENDPILSRLTSYRDSVQKNYTIAGCELTGPQSFDNRRKGFNLRLDEINAGQRLAEAKKAQFAAQRSYLDSRIAEFAAMIAAGKPVDAAMVQEVLDNLPADSSIPGMVDAFEVAHNARKAFTKARSKDSNEDAIAIAD